MDVSNKGITYIPSLERFYKLKGVKQLKESLHP